MAGKPGVVYATHTADVLMADRIVAIVRGEQYMSNDMVVIWNPHLFSVDPPESTTTGLPKRTPTGRSAIATATARPGSVRR